MISKTLIDKYNLFQTTYINILWVQGHHYQDEKRRDKWKKWIKEDPEYQSN